MVGTPPDAFASDVFAHPTDSSNLTAAWQIRGNFPANPWRPRCSRCHIAAAKKPVVAARKIAPTPFASGLPQDSRMQLMFGAADFSKPALSASRSFEFRARLRGDRVASRCLMLRKCFSQRWILQRTKPLAARCVISASSAALFRFARASQHRELPSVCRNAPEVCRKTR
jgi:hypothetical protein